MSILSNPEPARVYDLYKVYISPHPLHNREFNLQIGQLSLDDLNEDKILSMYSEFRRRDTNDWAVSKDITKDGITFMIFDNNDNFVLGIGLSTKWLY